MLQSQGLLHDTYVYGVDAKKTLTTIITPTEVMDGAIVSGNCVSSCDKNPTYVHMNNPVVTDLFEQHGKTLNFVGMIITNENVYLADKSVPPTGPLSWLNTSAAMALSSPRKVSATRIPT